MSRNGVLVTEQITLRAVFEDINGNLVDPDSAPTLYIYDPTFSSEDIDAEVVANVFTGLGPFTSTQVSTGYYEYTFTVPSGSDPGTWQDLWLAEYDSNQSYSIFEFVVLNELLISLQTLQNNQLVVIQLDSSIADVDGLTLGEDYEFTYSTRFDPLYASPELVRAEVGAWINFVPDDTLNLLIHWSSKEVDAITPPGVYTNHLWTCHDDVFETKSAAKSSSKLLAFAKTKFVILDAAWRVLMLPGAAEAANVSGAGKSKRLGDLSIQGPQNAGFGGSGLTQFQMNEIKKQRDEWWRVLNGAGTIVPGQGFAPALTIRGLGDPDRRRSGRLWEHPDDYPYKQPGANTKHRPCGRRRHRFIYGGS